MEACFMEVIVSALLDESSLIIASFQVLLSLSYAVVKAQIWKRSKLLNKLRKYFKKSFNQ